MYELYGKSKSNIQRAGCRAQALRSDAEDDLIAACQSLRRLSKVNTDAYRYTMSAVETVKKMEAAIDKLIEVSLDYEALFSKYYDEALYWELKEEIKNESV